MIFRSESWDLILLEIERWQLGRFAFSSVAENKRGCRVKLEILQSPLRGMDFSASEVNRATTRLNLTITRISSNVRGTISLLGFGEGSYKC